MNALQPDSDVKVVLVGLDRKFNYNKHCLAQLQLQANHALFLATNAELTRQVGEFNLPDAGSIVGSIHHSLNDRGAPQVVG